MKAKILYKHREDFDDGAIMEEFPFEFGTPETLIDKFLNEVSRLRRRK